MEKAQILIVEDDAIVAMDIESRLQNLGFIVSGAVSSGENAIKRIAEHDPDLVLMDIVLKDEMDGIEAAEIIRSRFGTPVIFVTAYADEKRLKRAKLTTPFGFILKPFQDKDLKVTIEMALHVNKADVVRRQAEESLRKSEAKLKERMKELNCLYSISALLGLPGISLGEIFEETIMLIPPAWQFPDITAARIVWDGQIFQTENFRKMPWMQTSKIIVHGKPVGQVEVCCLDEQPASNERPFMTEEQHLLNTIAERLGKIIERMSAREALRGSEEKFRSLVDSTNDWVWACDIEGRQTFANEAVKTILGYDVHEIEGILYENLIHPEDQRKTRQWFKSLIEKKKGWKNSVIRCCHKDGTIKFLESTAQPSFDSNGNLTGFIGIDRDFTERKRAEEALRESEEKYRSMMEAMDDEVYICSPDFRIEYTNPAMTRRIGYDATGEPCHKAIHGRDEKCPWCVPMKKF